jgi:hypothetical protein
MGAVLHVYAGGALARYLHRILIAVVSAAAATVFLAAVTSPAGATLVCPPGVTNPKYCTNVPPTATTGPATKITQTSAVLNGTAGPNVTNGDITTYYFQYGTTPAMTQTTPAGTIGSCPPGVTNPKYCTTPKSEAVSATITGLTPNTLYYYRLVAKNSDGTTPGSTETFRTLKKPVKVTPPIKRFVCPRMVKPSTFRRGRHHRRILVPSRFTCDVVLRVRAKVTFTFNHRTFREGTRTGTVRQTFTAPTRTGNYPVRVTAVGGNTTQIETKFVKVAKPKKKHHR